MATHEPDFKDYTARDEAVIDMLLGPAAQGVPDPREGLTSRISIDVPVIIYSYRQRTLESRTVRLDEVVRVMRLMDRDMMSYSLALKELKSESPNCAASEDSWHMETSSDNVG